MLVNVLETQEINRSGLISNNTLIRSGYQTVPFKIHYTFFLLLLINYLHFQTSKYFYSKLDIHNYNTEKRTPMIILQLKIRIFNKLLLIAIYKYFTFFVYVFIKKQLWLYAVHRSIFKCSLLDEIDKIQYKST